jgi:hypothetical protein
MGMSKLDEIVALFQNDLGEMPVAIIQNGTTPEEKVGIGTIETIQCGNKLSSAIIVEKSSGIVRKSRFYEELKSNHNTVLLYVWKELSIFLKCTKSICLWREIGLRKLFCFKSSPNANVEVC